MIALLLRVDLIELRDGPQPCDFRICRIQPQQQIVLREVTANHKLRRSFGNHTGSLSDQLDL